jgi:hypothetical protein
VEEEKGFILFSIFITIMMAAGKTIVDLPLNDEFMVRK